MPLRLDAEVPNDDADRISVRERPSVHLLGAQILERVCEVTPEMFVHFDHHSQGVVHRSAPVAGVRPPNHGLSGKLDLIR